MLSAPALEIDADRSAQLSGAGRAPKKIDFPSRTPTSPDRDRHEYRPLSP